VKALLAIMALGLLSACSTTVPVTVRFPEVPPELSEPCPSDLKPVPEGVSLSDLTKTVAENYTTYHECAEKAAGWIEWYETQRSIYGKFK